MSKLHFPAHLSIKPTLAANHWPEGVVRSPRPSVGWLMWSLASSGFLLLSLGLSGHPDLLGSAEEERKEMTG